MQNMLSKMNCFNCFEKLFLRVKCVVCEETFCMDCINSSGDLDLCQNCHLQQKEELLNEEKKNHKIITRTNKLEAQPELLSLFSEIVQSMRAGKQLEIHHSLLIFNDTPILFCGKSIDNRVSHYGPPGYKDGIKIYRNRKKKTFQVRYKDFRYVMVDDNLEIISKWRNDLQGYAAKCREEAVNGFQCCWKDIPILNQSDKNVIVMICEKV